MDGYFREGIKSCARGRSPSEDETLPGPPQWVAPDGRAKGGEALVLGPRRLVLRSRAVELQDPEMCEALTASGDCAIAGADPVLPAAETVST